MFSRGKRKKNLGQTKRTFLRVEHLEPRQMLNGTVDVQVYDPIVHPGIPIGDMNLVGDLQNNNIEIQSTANSNEYLITGKSGTSLSFNGFPVVPPPGVQPTWRQGDIKNIQVNLDRGTDVFDFEGSTVSSSTDSRVRGKLTIVNTNSNTNTINNVKIMEDLNIVNGLTNDNTVSNCTILQDFNVTRVAGAAGNSKLTISSTTVENNLMVDNQGVGGGGDSQTFITGSTVQESFSLTNGDGTNTLYVNGTSLTTQFGTEPPVGSLVTITNGKGGSWVQFDGSAATPLKVLGGMTITNGAAPGASNNIVLFNYVEVTGATNIDNGDGTTQVTANNSKLGTDFDSLGGPLAVNNGVGTDTFTLDGSTIPWGLFVNNDSVAGGTSSSGSTTTIKNSSMIGTRPLGPDLTSVGGTSGDALVVFGDEGEDIVNVSTNSQIVGGRVALTLYDGDNQINLANAVMPALVATTGDGEDRVNITACQILGTLSLHLGNANDTMVLQNDVLPVRFRGTIVIDGGSGYNTLKKDDATVLSMLDTPNMTWIP